MKMIKQRKESIELYTKGGRDDLIKKDCPINSVLCVGVSHNKLPVSISTNELFIIWFSS